MRVALTSAAVGLALANKVLVDRETKQPDPDGGRIVGELHIVEEGSPDAPAMVLLHGLAGSLRWFDHFAPLVADGHRLIRIDLLGHGGSAKPPNGYELDNQAHHVGLALEALGVTRALIVGHSMGGAVGVALAEQRPELVAALAIVDEGPDNSFGGFPLLARLALSPVLGELLHRVVPDPLVRDGYSDAFAKGYDLAAGFDDPNQVVRDYRRMTFTSYKRSTQLEDRFLRTRRLDERLRGLDVPSLVVFGEDDSFFRARDAAPPFESLPAARVEIIEGVGHSPHIEAPERLAALVAELESSVSAGAG